MRTRKGKSGKGRSVRRGIRREDVTPRKRRVTRSPKQEAIGGAMLSVLGC